MDKVTNNLEQRKTLPEAVEEELTVAGWKELKKEIEESGLFGKGSHLRAVFGGSVTPSYKLISFVQSYTGLPREKFFITKKEQ